MLGIPSCCRTQGGPSQPWRMFWNGTPASSSDGALTSAMAGLESRFSSRLVFPNAPGKTQRVVLRAAVQETRSRSGIGLTNWA